MSDNPKVDITTLMQNLRNAQLDYAKAEAADHEANSALSKAKQALSAAQKAIDDAMVTLRKGAPWDTHWKQQRGEPVSAT